MATDAERKARYRAGYRIIRREVHVPTLVAQGYLDAADVDNDAAVDEAGFLWLARQARVLPDMTAAPHKPKPARPRTGRRYQPRHGPVREVLLDVWQEYRAKVLADMAAKRLADAAYLQEEDKRVAQRLDEGSFPSLGQSEALYIPSLRHVEGDPAHLRRRNRK